MNFNEVRKGQEARRGTEGLNNNEGGETSFSSLFTLCGAAMYVYGPPSARAEFGGFYDQQLADRCQQLEVGHNLAFLANYLTQL